MSALDKLKTACTCCDGLSVLTPAEIFNRPGLAQLAYRVGNHALFKQTMLARISTRPALSALTTREDDDLTIALLDGWATVLDVLTFYNERHAHEGFLRTAVERRSLLELARLIGYELRPGVAASVDLAFTIDGGPGSPGEVVIPIGARAQSLPGQDELPQPFETIEEFTGHAEWNALRPRRFRPQSFALTTRDFYLEGSGLGLAAGDWLLLRADEGGEEVGLPVRIEAVEERTFGRVVDGDVRELTQVTLAGQSGGGGSGGGVGGFDFGLTDLNFGAVAPLPSILANHLAEAAVSAKVVLWYEQLSGLGFGGVARLANAGPPPLPPASDGPGLYAFAVDAAPFGHNAPRHRSLPVDWRFNFFDAEEVAYPDDWDANPPTVHQDSSRIAYTATYGNRFTGDEVILLERAFDEIEPEGFALLRAAGETSQVAAFQVAEAEKVSRSDFGIQGKATLLRLVADASSEDSEETVPGIDTFGFRETTILAGSHLLPLSEVPVDGPVSGAQLELDRALEGTIVPGQRIALTGERADAGGALVVREIRTVIDATLSGGVTVLHLDAKLEYSYRRDSLRINANVAPATHGESKAAILGSGDAGSPFQRFALKDSPLTYLPASTPSGGQSSLEVRVNGVAWHEQPDLYRAGPQERAFTTRRRDSGITEVLFGDSVRGTRLPSGNDNVTAEYRVGVGLDGHVNAGRISLIATPTLGVKEVINPLASGGGEDPEERDMARRNAPLTVLTLDRVVSLQDFEDFSRAFSGVGKARADWLWDGVTRRVHVTVAGADGEPLPADSPLPADLRAAIREFGDRYIPFSVGPFSRRLFTVSVLLRIHPDYEAEVVQEVAEAALAEAFSFAARDFGRAVHKSDLLAVLHRLDGIEAAQVETLALVPAAGGAPVPATQGAAGLRLDPLPARLGPPDERGRPTVLGAELLVLAPLGVTLGGLS